MNTWIDGTFGYANSLGNSINSHPMFVTEL